MSLPLSHRVIRRLKRAAGWHDDRFLRHAKGVVHVGANVGQERATYAAQGLPVIWVEPIPAVFAELEANLTDYEQQTAISALLTDVSGQTHKLHIASNKGASSSILPLKEHRRLWPTIEYTDSVTLTSTTLDDMMTSAVDDRARFDTLVLDTQGSELMVLQGAEHSLPAMHWIKVEAADFQSYEGCCVRSDIEAFLTERGFALSFSDRFAYQPGIGSYYSLVFSR